MAGERSFWLCIGGRTRHPTRKLPRALTGKKWRVYNNPYILGTAGWFWRTMWNIQGILNFGLEDTE